VPRALPGRAVRGQPRLVARALRRRAAGLQRDVLPAAHRRAPRGLRDLRRRLRGRRAAPARRRRVSPGERGGGPGWLAVRLRRRPRPHLADLLPRQALARTDGRRTPARSGGSATRALLVHRQGTGSSMSITSPWTTIARWI